MGAFHLTDDRVRGIALSALCVHLGRGQRKITYARGDGSPRPARRLSRPRLRTFLGVELARDDGRRLRANSRHRRARGVLFRNELRADLARSPRAHPRARSSRPRRSSFAVARGASRLLSGAALASQAWLGHAAMRTGAELGVELASYMAHVLAAGPDRRAVAARQAAFRAADRRKGTPAPMIAASRSGGSRTWDRAGLAHPGERHRHSVFRLKYFNDLFTSPYGWAILAKASLFFLMLVAAAINRWRLMPRLDNGEEARCSFAAAQHRDRAAPRGARARRRRHSRHLAAARLRGPRRSPRSP